MTFRRRRLTGTQGKLASPYPQIPNVGQTGHPAATPDPGPHEYETGTTSDFAEDIHPPPYAQTPAPATPGYDTAGDDHPAAKAASGDLTPESMKLLEKKSAKICNFVGKLAADDSDVEFVEKAALSLMALPEKYIDAADHVLRKMGYFSATLEVVASEDPEMEGRVAALEESVAETKKAMYPMIEEEEEEYDISETPGTNDMYNAMMQEESMGMYASGSGKNADHDEDGEGGDGDEMATKKAYLINKIASLNEIVKNSGDETVSKAASDAITNAALELGILVAADDGKDDDNDGDKDGKGGKPFQKGVKPTFEKGVNPFAKVDDKKAAKDGKEAAEDDKEATEDGKEAAGDGKEATEDGKEAAEDGKEDGKEAAEDGKEDDKEASEDGKEASAVLHETDIKMGNGDPLKMAAANQSDQDCLARLYMPSSKFADDDFSESPPAEDDALAGKNAGFLPTPRAPVKGVGPDSLGHLSRTASSGQSSGQFDIALLSSFWKTAPDVKEHF